MERRLFFIVILILVIGVGLIMSYLQKQPSYAEVAIGDMRMKVELADTVAKRQKGLSERASLDEDMGMLFIFDMPGNYGIWMKNMQFPIDIFWVNNGEIIDIAPNITHEDQKRTYYPRSESVYVLEFNAGFMEKNDIKIGDKVDIIF